MKDKQKLVLVKIVHTVVWAVMAWAACYILYAGIKNVFGTLLWICISLLVVESLVLVYNKWTCPLTPLAMKYTSDRDPSFDIYLPLVVAKYNKQIFGSIFLLGLVWVIFNKLNQ
jgi:hypothetical protein